MLRLATPSRAFPAIGIVIFSTADGSPQSRPLIGQSIVNFGRFDVSGPEAAKIVYHRLKLNEEAFAVTVRAIGALSMASRKYETLASLVTHVCETCEKIPQSALKDLLALGKTSGDVKAFLRVPNVAQASFERFRALGAEALGPSFRVPDAIILCCLIVAPLNQRLP